MHSFTYICLHNIVYVPLSMVIFSNGLFCELDDSEKRKEQLLVLQRSKLERLDTELVSMRKVQMNSPLCVLCEPWLCATDCFTSPQ